MPRQHGGHSCLKNEQVESTPFSKDCQFFAMQDAVSISDKANKDLFKIS